MLITLALTALIAASATVCLLSLVDSWIRGRSVFPGLLREKALLDAGFAQYALLSSPTQALNVSPAARPALHRALSRAARPTLASAMRPRSRHLAQSQLLALPVAA